MQKNASPPYQLILGSASPRRKELLASLFLPFEVHASHIEEKTHSLVPYEIVMDLANQKGRSVFEEVSKIQANPFVIGADTIVVKDKEILGKPKNEEEAKEMLRSLAGRSHRVLTGVSFHWKDGEHLFFEETEVFFSSLTEDLLEQYIQTGESLDKAGAYGIQSHSFAFISKVEGDYANVVGLPVSRVLTELKDVLKSSEDTKGKWRELFES